MYLLLCCIIALIKISRAPLTWLTLSKILVVSKIQLILFANINSSLNEMPPTELPRLTGSLRASSGLSSSHSQQPEIDDLLKRKRELRSKRQLERNLSWSELKSLILDATSFDKNATQEVFTYFLSVDFKWKEYPNGWWNISFLTIFTDIIGIVRSLHIQHTLPVFKKSNTISYILITAASSNFYTVIRRKFRYWRVCYSIL